MGLWGLAVPEGLVTSDIIKHDVSAAFFLLNGAREVKNDQQVFDHDGVCTVSMKIICRFVYRDLDMSYIHVSNC